MPEYVFRCPDDHLTERFYTYADRPKRIRCGKCKRFASPSIVATQQSLQLIPDVPEHFNVSMNMYVRSRRHLEQLQKEHGYSDFSPPAGPSTSWR